MKSSLDIALIQSHLAWENPVQNRANFEKKIASINRQVDLIILPEMFSTGFTMNASTVAENMNGETVQWMQKIAKKTGSALCGSIIIKEKGNYYNRFLFIGNDAMLQYYNKHQLFTLAHEQKVFTAGQEEVIIEYKGWKIKPQICYDLRFPVWARNTSAYDVLLYIASWPKLRIQAWDILLQARAIENMCYCIGVNRVGIDGKGYEYNGHSAIYDVLGNSILKENPIEKETIAYATLDILHIQDMRKKFSFLNDIENFRLF